MHWLATAAVTNALTATLLGVAVWVVSRCWQRPALAHLLWAIVLLKLLTPPLIEVPLACRLDLTWLVQQHDGPNNASAAVVEQTAAAAPQSSYRDRPSTAASFASKETPGGPDVANVEPSSARGEPRRAEVPGKAVSASVRPAAALLGSHFEVPRMFAYVVNSLPVIWLTGAAISLLVFARRAWLFQAFVHHAGRADVVLAQRVQSLARDVGLNSAPAAITVRKVVSPMLWGLGGRIRLIFPARLMDELPPAACDTLLLHELAHYARGDQWVRLIELLASVIFWWHPVVWWAHREIEAAEEQCCDAWVINARAGSRRTYAEALLATIDFLCEQQVLLPPAASGLGGADLLRVRLTQIMRGELAPNSSAAAKWFVLVTAVFLLPVGPGLFGASVRQLPKLPAAVIEPVPSSGTESAKQTPENAAPDAADQEFAPIVSAVAATYSTMAARPAPVITAVATSLNGKYRLERRKGSQVTLVNGVTGWRLDLSTHGILCAVFTPDSRQFLTGHRDGIVRIWDSETGGLAGSLKGGSDAAWSIAVTRTATGNDWVAAGNKDGSVFVWDLSSGDELAHLPPSESSVSCVRWSPRGDALAISFGEFSNREPNRVLLWSPLDHNVLAELPLENPLAALAWLPDENGLVMANWQGDTAVWWPTSQFIQPAGSLGEHGKQQAEAANWSADCPLTIAPLAPQLTAGAE